MIRRERFDSVLNLHGSGLGQEKIAAAIGLNRSTVQRLIWLGALPEPIRDSFFDGRLTEERIHELWKIRDSDRLLEVWRQWVTEPATVAVTRSGNEVRRAIQETTNPMVKATLEWFLGLRDTLP